MTQPPISNNETTQHRKPKNTGEADDEKRTSDNARQLPPKLFCNLKVNTLNNPDKENPDKKCTSKCQEKQERLLP